MRSYSEPAPFFSGVYLIFALTAFSLALISGWLGEPIFPLSAFSSPEVLGVSSSVDPRIATLQNFLETKKSPLAPHAAVFIEAADRYRLDWRLLPAIAGQESSFGKMIPWDKQNGEHSFNAWGWGIYGDLIVSFSSWEEGIWKTAEGLRNGYIDQGLLTLEEFMRFYTPRSDGSWARGVSFFMEQIASMESEHEQN